MSVGHQHPEPEPRMSRVAKSAAGASSAVENPDRLVSELEQRLEAVRETIAALSELGLDRLSAAERSECMNAVSKAVNSLSGLLVSTTAIADASGDARTLGVGSTTALLAGTAGMESARIKRLLRTARALSVYPRILQEACTGTLCLSALDQIAEGVLAARALEQPERDRLVDELATAARSGALSCVTDKVRAIRHETGLSRAVDDLEHARERSFARWTARSDGMLRLEVLLDPLRGALVQAALEGVVTRELRPVTDANGEDGQQPHPAAGGARKKVGRAEAKRAAARVGAKALSEIAEHFLSCGVLEPVDGVHPHLVVTIPADLLVDRDSQPEDASGGPLGSTGAVARTQFGGIVPPSVAQALSCYAEITAVTVGPAGEPLHVSRANRVPTAVQRDALILRDRHCRFPGCDRPWCIAHHVKPWSGSDAIELDEIVLLCEEHHMVVHRDKWTVARGADGSFTAAPPARPAEEPAAQGRSEA